MIEPFVHYNVQVCVIDGKEWSVARLIQLTKDYKPFKMPIIGLYVHYTYDNLTLKDMVSHMIAVNDADLSYPIILDECGILMDGRHRVMKALMLGKKHIKAVRFGNNPSPCHIRSE